MRFFAANSPRAFKAALFALALVFAQIGSALHAQQHAFHQATPVCDAFFAVGSGALVPSAPVLFAIAFHPVLAPQPAIAPAPFSARHDPRQSRAPPSILI